MAMAPEVFKFTREFGRGQQIQEKPSVIQQIAGTLGNVALAGAGLAGAYGLARALGPETPSKGQIGTLNSATIDLNPDYSPPTVESGPEFDVQGDISSPAQQSDFYITEKESNTAPIAQSAAVISPTKDERQQQHIHDWYDDPDKRLDQVIALDDAHEERFGMPAGRQIGNIGSLQEQPTDEIVVVEEPQTAATTPQIDPRSFLSSASNALISKAQEEVDAFDQGINWGQRFDQAASADSPLKGAAIVAGTVAEKGAKDIATRVGKDLDTAGNIVSEAVANVQKIPAAMQEVDSVIANEQMKASVMPDNKMQETTYLNPPVSGTGGVETGIESDLSDAPQFDDPHQSNEQASIAGLNRQTGITTSSTTNLNPDFVRDQANKLQLNIPYADKVKLVLSNLSGSIANSPIAQAGDQAAKKVVRGVLRTVAGEEKFQEMAAENLREQQAERMRSMAGNEARMANVRSKYSMDYNPAAPKLPGDAIIGLKKDRFGSSAYIPIGGSDWLRDESLPASAYDVKVPREDEETPLWWEV